VDTYAGDPVKIQQLEEGRGGGVRVLHVLQQHRQGAHVFRLLRRDPRPRHLLVIGNAGQQLGNGAARRNR